MLNLHFQKVLGCASTTTRPHCFKSNLTIDVLLNDVWGENRSTYEFNLHHVSYSGGKTNWQRNSVELFIKLACQRRKYIKRRINYYSNSVAQFNILLLAGDIETNPCDVKNPCSVCAKSVAKNNRAILCDSCQLWCHIRCGRVSLVEYNRLVSTTTFPWTCQACICRALPFYNDIFIDEPCLAKNGRHSIGILLSNENETLLQSVFQKQEDKLKIAHLNVKIAFTKH